jgi:hypothetical protein
VRPQPQRRDLSELPVRPSASAVVPEPSSSSVFALVSSPRSPLPPHALSFANHGL